MCGRAAAFLALIAALASGLPDLASPRAASAGAPQLLRVLQFNVLNGATGDRAAAVAAVIGNAHPDVATLDEVNDYSTFMSIAAATGLHAFFVRANDGFNVGLLSRYPLHACVQLRQAPIRHAAYGCRIDVRGRPWWIFGAHLYPFDESVRAQEIAVVINEMRKHASGRVVLGGDLNTDAPGQPTGLGTKVVPLLRAAGFRDAFRELHPWPGDPGLTASTPAYGHWEHRIDYVFHSRSVRAVSARVVDTVDGYAWPSDHAALLVQLAAASGAR